MVVIVGNSGLCSSVPCCACDANRALLITSLSLFYNAAALNKNGTISFDLKEEEEEDDDDEEFRVETYEITVTVTRAYSAKEAQWQQLLQGAVVSRHVYAAAVRGTNTERRSRHCKEGKPKCLKLCLTASIIKTVQNQNFVS